MFDIKYLLLVAAAAAVLPRGSGRSLELTDVINRTVCAIEVNYDKNSDRIPRVIKTITCAASTNRGCVAHRIGHSHCCHHENKMECVEMRDTVLVYNKKLKAPESIEVPVGCACMIRDVSQAEGLPDPHGS